MSIGAFHKPGVATGQVGWSQATVASTAAEAPVDAVLRTTWRQLWLNDYTSAASKLVLLHLPLSLLNACIDPYASPSSVCKDSWQSMGSVGCVRGPGHGFKLPAPICRSTATSAMQQPK